MHKCVLLDLHYMASMGYHVIHSIDPCASLTSSVHFLTLANPLVRASETSPIAHVHNYRMTVGNTSDLLLQHGMLSSAGENDNMHIDRTWCMLYVLAHASPSSELAASS